MRSRIWTKGGGQIYGEKTRTHQKLYVGGNRGDGSTERREADPFSGEKEEESPVPMGRRTLWRLGGTSALKQNRRLPPERILVRFLQGFKKKTVTGIER